MSLESLLANDFVTVQQQTVTQDASGGPVRAWANLYTNVPARVIDPTASERLRFMMLGTEAPHRVLHQRAGVGEGMLILTSDGRTLKVQGTRKVRQLIGISTYYESSCVEWRPGA